jgi:magnesium transporter
VPTLIVGVYGQNLKFPERLWGYWGYAWSWALIILTTLAQVLYFRRKRWL